jgi:hypothetical protein
MPIVDGSMYGSVGDDAVRRDKLAIGKCSATSVRKASRRLTQLRDEALAHAAARWSCEIVASVCKGITRQDHHLYRGPLSLLDMTIEPGFGAPTHISLTEGKLSIVIGATRVPHRRQDRDRRVRHPSDNSRGRHSLLHMAASEISRTSQTTCRNWAASHAGQRP